MNSAREQSKPRLALISILALSGAIALCPGAQVRAQDSNLVPDNTLGSEGSVVNVIDELNDRIDGGATRGANLFHSFLEFQIGAGRGAYFANPDGIANILSRVTGNNPSNILGRLGVLGEANLFLINPNGIIFGPNASLELGGSFVATTANAVQFGDRGFFSATAPNVPSSNLTVNPSALFFNQIAAGPIVNRSQALSELDPSGSFNPFGLRVPEGKNLLFVGGDIDLDGGGMVAFEGRVELGAVAGTGTVALNADTDELRLSLPTEISRANVSLADGAGVIVSGGGGGSIAINAANIDILSGSTLTAGILNSLGSANAQAGDITLNATEAISVENGFVFNQVFENALGNGGGITVKADNLSLTNGSQLRSNTFGQGNAGSILVDVAQTATFADNTIVSASGRPGGDISISATNLNILQGSTIATGIRPGLGFADSQAGDVVLNATEAIAIDNSFVFSQVFENAQGNGGDLFVETKNLTIANGGEIGGLTFGQGNAGNVNVTANSLSLVNNALIDTRTSGVGDAGNVKLEVIDSVVLDGSSIFTLVETNAIGDTGDIEINAGSLAVNNGSSLRSNTLGQGNAGSIKINTTGLVSFDNSSIDSVDSGIVGGGGEIAIKADAFWGENAIVIAGGEAGEDISIGARNIEILSGSTIATDASPGSGSADSQAGNVTLNATETIAIDNSLIFNGVLQETIGQAGNVAIATDSLSLSNARIDTSTSGVGSAGSVRIDATDSVTLEGSSISTAVEIDATGEAGDVEINAGSLTVNNGSLLSSSTSGQGDTGNMAINAREQVSLDNSNIYSDVNFGAVGNGGTITIQAGNLFLTNGAQISASIFGEGQGENLTIEAGQVSVLDGASVSVNSFGQGSAGRLQIQAQDSVEVVGTDLLGSPSRLTAEKFSPTVFEDSVGEIDIETNSLSIRDGGRVSTANFIEGGAGNIQVKAADTVEVVGQGLNLLLGISLPSTLSASFSSEGVGSGGNISVETSEFVVRGGAVVTADNLGEGQAGNLSFVATELVEISQTGFDGSPSRLSSNSFSAGSSGNVTIDTGKLIVSEGAEVTASNLSTGNSGNLTVRAADSVVISGNSSLDVSGLDGSITLRSEGDVSLADGALLNVTGAGGGELMINARNLDISEGSGISAGIKSGLGTTDAQAGDITLTTGEEIKLNDGFILNQISSEALGTGGNIDIQARSLSLTNGSILGTFTSAQGNAGDISIRTTDSVGADNNSSIGLPTAGAGNGGSLLVETGRLAIQNEGNITTTTNGTGHAGNILIRAADAAQVINGEIISRAAPPSTGNTGAINIQTGKLIVQNGARVATDNFSTGQGGNLRVSASDSVQMTGAGTVLTAQTTDAGDAGDLTLQTNQLYVGDEAFIRADTSGTGEAGDVLIQATDAIVDNAVISSLGLSGNGGNIFIEAAELTVRGGEFGEISTETAGQGNAGNMTIEVGKLSLVDGGEVTASTTPLSDAGIAALAELRRIYGEEVLELTTSLENSTVTGNAGDITIRASDSVEVSGTSSEGQTISRIRTQVEEGSTGTGGNLQIDTHRLIINDGAQIQAGTFDEGQGGTLTLTAAESVEVSGTDGEGSPSGLFTATFGGGDSGDLKITTSRLSIREGATVSASTAALSGEGKAGNLTINASELVEVNGTSEDGELTSSIVAETGRILNFLTGAFPASGGDLTINTEKLVVQDGAQVSTQTIFRAGDAGDLSINADSVTIEDEALITTAAIGGGTGQAGDLSIMAPDSVQVIEGFLRTRTDGAGDAGNLSITTGRLIVQDSDVSAITDGTSNTIDSESRGRGGDLRIIASDSVIVKGRDGLGTSSFSGGDAGNLTIQTARIDVQDGASITTAALLGSGKAGNLEIIASDSVEVIGGRFVTGSEANDVLGVDFFDSTEKLFIPSQITAESSSLPNKPAGNLSIQTGQLAITGGALVTSRTLGSNPGGSINVNASELVEVAGTSANGEHSGLSAQTIGSGDAGNIKIETSNLRVRDGGEVSASTSIGGRPENTILTTGRPGNITIQNTDSVLLSNDGSISTAVGVNTIVKSPQAEQGGNINIQTGQLLLTNGAQVTASTSGQGDAGSIIVREADSVSLFNSSISTAVNAGAVGQGGAVNIQTSSLSLDDQAQISASTSGEGDAGSISAIANVLEASNGGQFLTATASGSDAGNITLEVVDSITFTGTDSGLFASTAEDSSGNGGSIFIDPQLVVIQDGATVAVNSQGTGIGGNINLIADALTLDHGTISAETASNTGGEITLQISDLLQLQDNSQISATAGTAQAGGDGGNINIEADFILAFPENNDITANAFEGQGGNINLTAQGIFGLQFRDEQTPLNDITASSEFGAEGVVEINTPEVDPAQGLVSLPTEVVDVSGLIAQSCLGGGATASRESEFVVTGRGGLPANPTEALRGEALLSAEWVSLEPEEVTEAPRATVPQPDSSSPQQMVEPQGWVVGPNGNVILTASSATASPQSPWSTPSSCHGN